MSGEEGHHTYHHQQQPPPPSYQQQSYQQQPYQQQPPPQVVYVQQPVIFVPQPQPQQQQQYSMTQPILQKGDPSGNFQSMTVSGESGEFECGTSTYGLRMDFKNRPYRDVGFLVAWLLSLLVWFIMLVAFAAKSGTNSDDSSSRRLADSSSDDDNNDEIGSDFVGKIIGAFVLVCTTGIFCGFLWLSLMFRWAKNILKFLIGLKLLFWALLSLVCFIAGIALGSLGDPLIGLGVVCLFVFALLSLYYWCVRRRLRLAAAMIRLGTKVVQSNKGTICLQFLTSIALFVWWILWVAVWTLYVLKYQYSGFISFLMVIMGYWTLNVLANIAHVTTCGVTAVWWFNSDKMAEPTWQSYRYAVTRGLGSICCGSLLVAIIQTLRSMARQGARRGGFAACICYVILTVMEWIARYFSVYAYVQVAIYGVSFWQAAKNTWQLLSSRGFDAIINDDLSNMVLAAGAFVGGILTFVFGGLISYIMFSNYDDNLRVGIAIVMAIVGLYIGYYFTLEFMYAVYSAIKTIFVCWAEDPDALKRTHPICFELMANAWAKVRGDCNYDTLKTDYELD